MMQEADQNIHVHNCGFNIFKVGLIYLCIDTWCFCDSFGTSPVAFVVTLVLQKDNSKTETEHISESFMVTERIFLLWKQASSYLRIHFTEMYKMPPGDKVWQHAQMIGFKTGPEENGASETSGKWQFILNLLGPSRSCVNLHGVVRQKRYKSMKYFFLLHTGQQRFARFIFIQLRSPTFSHWRQVHVL